MKKRTILLGEYDTAAHGLWTLCAYSFPEPDLVENFVQVPGRIKGPLDMSTALTDGEPRYNSRPLSVTLESSEGNREDRAARISDMINQLHGQQKQIVLPDHPLHYAVGRLSVKQVYNDMAHAAVEVTAVCEPWLYAAAETVATLEAAEEAQTVTLCNTGAMTVVPQITVTGDDADLLLIYGTASQAVSAGSYVWPALVLTPGLHELRYSGSGKATISYREAVLR